MEKVVLVPHVEILLFSKLWQEKMWQKNCQSKQISTQMFINPLTTGVEN